MKVPRLWVTPALWPVAPSKYIFLADAAAQMLRVVSGKEQISDIEGDQVKGVIAAIGQLCRDDAISVVLLPVRTNEFWPGRPADWIGGSDVDRLSSCIVPRRPNSEKSWRGSWLFVTKKTLDPVLLLMRARVDERSRPAMPEELPSVGRPQLAHKVMPEFERRIGAGEVLRNVTGEAKALAAWYASNYPIAAGHKSLRPKTIEPYIRERVNALKSKDGNPLESPSKSAGN